MDAALELAVEKADLCRTRGPHGAVLCALPVTGEALEVEAARGFDERWRIEPDYRESLLQLSRDGVEPRIRCALRKDVGGLHRTCGGKYVFGWFPCQHGGVAGHLLKTLCKEDDALPGDLLLNKPAQVPYEDGW